MTFHGPAWYPVDYRYSRACARSFLFSFLNDSIPVYGMRKRFMRAWKLLDSADRALLRGHQHGFRGDWGAERAAVDRLVGALRLADEMRNPKRKLAA